eukprot:2124593-Prymnesium_polylepis.2
MDDARLAEEGELDIRRGCSGSHIQQKVGVGRLCAQRTWPAESHIPLTYAGGSGNSRCCVLEPPDPPWEHHLACTTWDLGVSNEV